MTRGSAQHSEMKWVPLESTASLQEVRRRGACYAPWRGNQPSPECSEVDWTKKKIFFQQISGKKKGKEEGDLFIEKDLRGLLLASACCLPPNPTLFLCCLLSDQAGLEGLGVGRPGGARPTVEVLVAHPTTRWGCGPGRLRRSWGSCHPPGSPSRPMTPGGGPLHLCAEGALHPGAPWLAWLRWLDVVRALQVAAWIPVKVTCSVCEPEPP